MQPTKRPGLRTSRFAQKRKVVHGRDIRRVVIRAREWQNGSLQRSIERYRLRRGGPAIRVFERRMVACAACVIGKVGGKDRRGEVQRTGRFLVGGQETALSAVGTTIHPWCSISNRFAVTRCGPTRSSQSRGQPHCQPASVRLRLSPWMRPMAFIPLLGRGITISRPTRKDQSDRRGNSCKHSNARFKRPL